MSQAAGVSDAAPLAQLGRDERHRPSGARRVRTIARVACVFVTPAIVFFAVGARSVEPMNGQDGYIYAGAIVRLRDFLARFPDTYYGVRFGYIIPAMLFRRFFGLELGHHLLRFLLLGAIATQVAARSRLRLPGALVAAVLLTMSPIVLVATFSTYTMSIGVPALVLGAVLLSSEDQLGRASVLRSALAGALLAISWNAHIVALVPSLAVVAVYAADLARRRDLHPTRCVIAHLAALGAGTVGVVAAGVLVYGLRYGLWDVFGPTFAQSSKGTSEVFRYPGLRWLSWRHYLLVAPLAIASGTSVWLTEHDQTRRTALRRMTCFSIAIVGVYAVFQWVRGDTILESYFHSALPLAVCSVTMAMAMAVVVIRSRAAWPVALTIIGLSAGCLLLGSRVRGPYWAVLAASSATLLLLGWMSRRRAGGLMVVGVGAAMLVASWSSVSSPHDFPGVPGGYRVDPFYDLALFSYDGDSMGRVAIVDELSQLLPSLPSERGEVVVWFDPAGPLDQLAAPLLWYRSSMQSVTDDAPPVISPHITYSAVFDRPRFAVIVAQDGDAASLGAQAIAEVAPYTVVMQRAISGGDYTAFIAVLERAAGTWQDFPCAGHADGRPAVCSATGG